MKSLIDRILSLFGVVVVFEGGNLHCRTSVHNLSKLLLLLLLLEEADEDEEDEEEAAVSIAIRLRLALSFDWK